jgi:glucokinase
MPNPFDYERGISYMKHKFQQLYGIELRHPLSQCLHCGPANILFLNDAAAFLIGELSQGAARNIDRAVGITLGTGVGSAFAVDGEIAVAGYGIPPGGEIWNLPYLGSTVEDVISTRAIQRQYLDLTGGSAEVREIANLAADSGTARQTLERFGTELGKVLRHICGEFAPQRIVFGGGISRAAEFFLPAAAHEMAQPATQLCVSELFDRAPLVGAGVRWKQHFASVTEKV